MKQLTIYIYASILAVLSLMNSCNHQQNHPAIKVKINDTLYSDNVSGKLIFLFSSDTTENLVYWINPDKPHPVFTYDVKNWNPKDTIVIERFTDEWYKKIADLNGEFACRVLFDVNTKERSSFVAKNNGYSKKLKHIFEPSNQKDPLYFEVNNKFDGWIFSETETIKEIKLKSNLLSNFWGKDIFIESAVILPEKFNPVNNNYPIVYVFPGFGSNHASVTYGSGQIDRYGMNKVGEQKIFVFMNGEFFQGYHHFADSDNNGPWGKAFIEEFVPYIDNKFGSASKKSERYLMGQSSGAWTALWLQINYPDYFEDAFAASPDPIDFRAHGFDIYKNHSNYYFPENADSADILKGNKTKIFAQLEDVLGEFGQIRTWEATFSPKTDIGEIGLLFDRESGDINPEVVKNWSKYDISQIIGNHPDKYKKVVSEKLHIFVSKDDPYGLNKSVELFDEVLKQNSISADIQYFDNMGHNVWTDDLRKYIHTIIDHT